MSGLYCDICGEAFTHYVPELVVCRMPKDESSHVVHMCKSCEQKALDALLLGFDDEQCDEPEEEDPMADDGESDDELEPAFPIYEHHATCEFELYKFGTAYLRVFIDQEKSLTYEEKGIEVITIGDAYYIIVEVEDKAIISELNEIDGYFLANVTFSAEKDEHGEVNWCKLDKIEVYASMTPNGFAYSRH